MAEPADTQIADAPPDTSDAPGSFNNMATKLKANLEQIRNPPSAPEEKTPEKPPAAPPNNQAKPEPTKPPVKTEPARTETKPAVEDVPPTIKGKAADEFRNLRSTLTTQIESTKAELATHQAKVVTLEAEIAAAKKTQVVTPEELTKLKGERDDLLSRVERLSLAESPQFQAKYSRAFQHARESAAAAAGEKNKDVVAAILEMPPSATRKAQLGEVLKGLDPVDQMALSVAINEMDRTRGDRDAELSNHRAAIQRMNEENLLTAKQQQDRELAKRQILSVNALKAAQENFTAFKPDENDPEVAGRIADLQKDIDATLSGNITESQRAMLPVIAAQGVFLQTVQVPKLEARIAELEAELTARAAANPEPARSGKQQEFASEKPGQSAFANKFKKLMNE